MKRKSFIVAYLLMIAGFACLLQAQVPMTGAGKATVGVGVTYTGPGDIASGALAWWGLRAYNAAYAANVTKHAIDIVDSGGINPATIDILSTGALDMATLNTWIGAHGTASVTKIYDQTGNAWHLIMATVSAMPTINVTAIGSLPGMVFTTAANTALNSASTASVTTQPYSFSIVADVTTNANRYIVAEGNSGVSIAASATADKWKVQAGSAAEFSATVNAFHAVQALINGNSSQSYVDGSSTTGLASGATNFANPSQLTLGVGAGVGANMTLCESGIWTSDKSANFATINSNQHTYWGF